MQLIKCRSRMSISWCIQSQKADAWYVECVREAEKGRVSDPSCCFLFVINGQRVSECVVKKQRVISCSRRRLDHKTQNTLEFEESTQSCGRAGKRMNHKCVQRTGKVDTTRQWTKLCICITPKAGTQNPSQEVQACL